MFANTTAVKSEPGCVEADSVNMTQAADGSGWTNTATLGSCSFTWSVDKSTENLFGELRGKERRPDQWVR